MEAKDTFTATGPAEADGYVHLPFTFNLNDRAGRPTSRPSPSRLRWA